MDTVSVTVSRTDWEAVVIAVRVAADCMRDRSLRSGDPEVQYHTDRAGLHYRDLADRMSALVD